MDDNHAPRALSHDEKLAAEAAFARRPFNAKWSARARTVYDGIVRLLPAPPSAQEEASELMQAPSQLTETGPSRQQEPLEREQQSVPTMIPFKQAIETGALIDVTATAKQLGLSFPVTVTKPLWEVGIAPTNTLTQEEQSARLRDVLMAFRLRLATQPSISPLIDFPALLALPPGAVPQPVPLFALIQPDEDHRATVTLLMPNEVAATIIPLN
jgi:uncharacterized protein DUF6573